jgi:hypothetical protein
MAKKRKLTKEEVSKLVAKDLLSLSRKNPPSMYRAIPIHPFAPVSPKTEKVATSKGKASKVNILKLRKEILAEVRDEQLNF